MIKFKDYIKNNKLAKVFLIIITMLLGYVVYYSYITNMIEENTFGLIIG